MINNLTELVDNMAGLSKFLKACDLCDGVLVTIGKAEMKDGSIKDIQVGDGLYLSDPETGTVKRLCDTETLKKELTGTEVGND